MKDDSQNTKIIQHKSLYTGTDEKLDVIVLNESQLRCLISSNRVAIIRAMRESDGLSARNISARLGTTPEALHHHLRSLLREGIIREVGTRRAGKRDERLYGLAARKYTMDMISAEPAYRQLIRKAIERSIKFTAVEYFEASKKADTELDLESIMLAERFHFWLSREDAEELKRRANLLIDWASERNRLDADCPMAGLMILTPVIGAGFDTLLESGAP